MPGAPVTVQGLLGPAEMAAEGSSTVNKSGTAKVFQKPLPLACKRQRLFSFTSAVLFRAHRQNHSHPHRQETEKENTNMAIKKSYDTDCNLGLLDGGGA